MQQFFFFINSFPKSYPWYLNGLKWLLVALLGAFIGSFISYEFTCWRDKKLDKKEKFNELNAVSNSVCFYLALQQSELTKLIMDIKKRIDILHELPESKEIPRNTLILITQDFNVCENLQINMENVGKIILSVTENCKDIVESLQEIFISNEWYLKSISMLERFGDFKKSISQNERFLELIFGFVNSNFPVYEKQIKKTISFNKNTLETFSKKMQQYFGIKINVTTGEVIKLN